MSGGFPWGPLGIDKTSDTKVIRTAYAAKLKALNLDEEVAAYAELRDARDVALQQARQANAPAVLDGDGLFDEGPLDSQLTGGDLSSINLSGNLHEGISFSGDGDFGDGAEPDPEPDPEAEASRERAVLFLGALFPNGQKIEDPLSDEEYTQATTAMREIISEAHNSDIGAQQSIQDWIAHHLADAWPRSSLLVIEVAKAFQWSANEGEIGENPAIAFLNARLAGIAFMEELENPSHPLHKAWAELQKPGRRGDGNPLNISMPFTGPKFEDFVTLINTIRGHFPELEDYLEPERVESWEAGKSTGSIWSKPIVIVIFVALFIGAIGNFAGSDRKTAQEILAPPVITTQAWSDEQKTDLIEELFGPIEVGDLDYLTDSGTDFWQAARSYTAVNYTKEMDEYMRGNLTQALRSMTQMQSESADFDQLLAIKQLKMELTIAARDHGGAEACVDMMQRSRMPANYTVPEGLRVKERTVARDLLNSGLFETPITRTSNRQANIPGDIWQAALAKSGLSQSAAEDAAMSRGPDKAWCDFKLALAAEVLRRPGKVSLDLLHIQ